ncbi:unknown protein [Desulfotalea psychrophila LSv54]|uniref:Uncharacterized protein n=1 Tax=Desulfotalea psychrophila (strain LSv54 / DSM 12343) TaxID=177439 RepID=Q6AJN2_DESPS|nr:unknown protein [Desulfotalea psychrophila LSv54]
MFGQGLRFKIFTCILGVHREILVYVLAEKKGQIIFSFSGDLKLRVSSISRGLLLQKNYPLNTIDYLFLQ